MSNDQLIFDLVLETKQAVAGIQSMLAKTNSAAATEGKKAGTSFGVNLKSAILTIASGISFGFLTRQIQGLFGTFQRYTNANFQLQGAISAVNQKEQERFTILNDSKASIEQKAMAIGLDTSEIYENTKATKTNEGAIKSLEASIRKQEDAFEDVRRARENDIKSMEKKRDLEIAEIRRQRGFGALTEDQQKKETELSNLEIQRQEARLAGDFTAAAQIQNQIDLLKVQKSITDEKLKQIDNQTDKVEDLYKVQIQALRTELEASKNKFDIDIEPAKRKLEELRATSVSVGGGQVLKKGVLDQINAAAKEAPKALKEADFNNLREELFKKYKGIVPRDALTSAISDLVKGGLRDTDQIEATVSRFVDIAAAGKSPFISMGEAVSQLGEQFRSERAALGETAGLTEEYISQILPRGLALLQAEGKLRGKKVEDLNEEERAMAKQAGLLDMTADRQGLFQKKQEDGLMSTEELRAEFEKMALVLALELGPMIMDVAKQLLPLVKQLTDFVTDNPKVVLAIGAVATAFAGIITVVTGVMFLWPALVIGFKILLGVISLIFSPLGLFIAQIVLAYTQIEWFRDLVNVAFKKIVEWVNWLKNNWIQALGAVLGFLVSLFNPLTWAGWATRAVMAVFNYLRGVDWGSVWNRITDAFKNALEGVQRWFNSIDWGQFLKKGWNGFVDFLRGFLRGLLTGVPGGDGIANEVANKIPRFATGGEFMVGGQPGIDKNLVQFMATRGEKVIVQTPTQQRTDNRQINSGNTQIIYTSKPDIFTPSFI